MSRNNLPPLPYGLPPRPPTGPARDRERGSYHPADNHRESIYHFQGQSSNSSRAPGTRSPPRDYSDVPRGPAADSYRPQERSYRNFDFRYDAPPGVDFRRDYDRDDRYRPGSPPPGHRQRSHGNNSRLRNQPERPRYDRDSHNSSNRNGPRKFRTRPGPRMASDRAFLRGNRAPTPDLMQGMEENSTQGAKYAAVENLSDSEEADMDVSDSDDDDDSKEPKAKQARTIKKANDGDSVPRWSNPDPYTALPPPDESQRKKIDVVKLIRKARAAAGAEPSTKPKQATENFISFNLDALDNNSETGNDTATELLQGLKFDHRDDLHGPEPSRILQKPGVPSVAQTISTSTSGDLPTPKVKMMEKDTASAKKGSKRMIDGEVKNPPDIYRAVPTRKAFGTVLPEWACRKGMNSTPWVQADNSETLNMGTWLHKEIMAFYEFVKPLDFEEYVRTELVQNLREKVKRHFHKDCDIRAFGSFPARLYLPTADMDLVLVSDKFMSGGRGRYNSRGDLMAFSKFLNTWGLALPKSIEVVIGAKVPLVKYRDKSTGLKVDISFENDTGLTANHTFQHWRTQYPAMPILVTVIKHLLAMRGLNEPFNGGIGGFSVTCLVVSLLQNMPQVQGDSLAPENCLGEVLMEFFDLYGNQFNTATTAIRLNPPGYVSKALSTLPAKRNMHISKFCIVDPNNHTNDLTGGAQNTPIIQRFFSTSYAALQARMDEVARLPDRRNASLLGCILGGDYSLFELQRAHLAHIHTTVYGSA